MAADGWTKRVVWFILILSLIIGMVTVIFIMEPDDNSCYNFKDVVSHLWTCTGMPYDIDSSCCHKIEAEVNEDCGWYTADFCSYFADAANEYCHVNYCPVEPPDLQSLVSNGTKSG